MHASDHSSDPPATSAPPLPPGDLARALTVARPEDDESLPHLGIVGDTYTIVLRGVDTNGRFTLIDMRVPPGGGPGPHRHDFEETFVVLDGEIEVTFRGEPSIFRAGETINLPANAPHAFHNSSREPARLLCLCSPAGQDEFFLELGVRAPTRTAAPPPLDATGQAAFQVRAKALAPRSRTELLDPSR